VAIEMLCFNYTVGFS